MENPSPSVAETPIVKNPIIKCAHDARVNPQMLRPNPMNPNTHPPRQIEKFIEIITYTGWRRPITVSNRSQLITKGHGALEAAKAAGWSVVPVDYQDYDDDAQEMADIMADKFLAEMSTMDNAKLTVMLLKLDQVPEFNLNMTAMELPKIEQLMIDVPEWQASRKSFEDLSVPDFQANQETQAQYAPEGQQAGGPAMDQPYHGDSSGQPTRVASSHVRMIQLFFNQESVAEFSTIVDYFQKKLNIDNVTDAVLEVLREAMQREGEEDVKADPSQVSTPV